MISEFKKFALKGNMLDMAVGIIIGAAFSTIVSSLVDDIIMPPMGMILGNVDFANWFIVLKEGKTAAPYASVALAKEAGAITWNIGLFINAIIKFVIVAFALFIVIRNVNKLKEQEEAAPAKPAEPPRTEVLLAEIRDALQQK